MLYVYLPIVKRLWVLIKALYKSDVLLLLLLLLLPVKIIKDSKDISQTR